MEQPRSIRSLLAPTPVYETPRGEYPTFSVAIAAYRAASFVGDAIRSALDQVPPPLEVVVCDDASNDGIETALAHFGDAVRLVQRQVNGGEAAAKNDAARASRGDFIAFLDADDLYRPGYLDALGTVAEARPDLDIIAANADIVSPDGSLVGRFYEGDRSFPVADQRREILSQNFVIAHAAVRRSRFMELGGYDPAIRYSTDWDLWLRMILEGARVGLVDLPLSIVRLNPQSLSTQRLAMAEGRLQTLAKAARDPRLSDEERALVHTVTASSERRRDREAVRAALLDPDQPKVRGLAARIALDRGQPRRLRARCVAAILAPRLVGGALRRREAGTWTTMGDRTYPLSAGHGVAEAERIRI